jgi:hypothetical protein
MAPVIGGPMGPPPFLPGPRPPLPTPPPDVPAPTPAPTPPPTEAPAPTPAPTQPFCLILSEWFLIIRQPAAETPAPKTTKAPAAQTTKPPGKFLLEL